jgi:maltodextrin utilization protein YvdJ
MFSSGWIRPRLSLDLQRAVFIVLEALIMMPVEALFLLGAAYVLPSIVCTIPYIPACPKTGKVKGFAFG